MFREIEKPKLVKVTHTIARAWKDMQRFPHDREIQPSRMEYLKRSVASGEFRGSEWVSARCKETGLTYRLNGKHTSHALVDAFEGGQVPQNVFALVRHYECDTMEDCARLYATFDAKQSARSRGDIIRGFANANPDFEVVPQSILGLIAAGMAYSKWEQASQHKSVVEHAMLLIENPEFVLWASKLLQGDNKHTRHIKRKATIAAMTRTWFKNKEKANEFWTYIREDCDLPKNSPVRVLYRWLLSTSLNVGGATNATGKTVANAREMLARCIHSWNNWRKGVMTETLRYHRNSPIPQAA